MTKTRKMTFLITGITGYIGSMIAKMLVQTEAYKSGKFLIVGLCRDREKAEAMFDYLFDENFRLIIVDILDYGAVEKKMLKITPVVDYIIHCAANTQSAYMVSNPIETSDGIVLGTCSLLKLAKNYKIESMVFLSSMEVYGDVADIGRLRKEDELGTVRLDNSRSCYPLGKRMAEHYCYAYAKEYGVPVKIARLAQTFGKGVRPEDNRVYMQFARAVVDRKDIVLKTEGLSMGNYCAIDDVVNAIFTILQRGIDGEAYNVVNEANTMCIKDMAQLVAERIADGNIKVKIELDDSAKTGYAPDTGLRLSGEKLRQLGWKPTKGLEEMYRDVIAELS